MIKHETYECKICGKISKLYVNMVCHTNISSNFDVYIHRGKNLSFKKDVYEECFMALMESMSSKNSYITEIDYIDSINCFDIYFKKNYPQYKIKEYLLEKYKESKELYFI